MDIKISHRFFYHGVAIITSPDLRFFLKNMTPRNCELMSQFAYLVPSLKLTNMHLKMNGWNPIRLPFGAAFDGLFSSGRTETVSFREWIQSVKLPMENYRNFWGQAPGIRKKIIKTQRWCQDYPPKFNSEFSPEKLPKPNRKGLSSNHHFSGASC